MSCKLFLGGVLPSTSDDTIRHHFARFGAVADAVVLRDRGFGFVTFESQDGADAAIAQPRQSIDGQIVDVKLAQGKGGRGGGGGGGRGGGGGGGRGGAGPGGPTDKVFVGGLPQDCSDDKIRSYFQQYGTIVDCVVMMDKSTGRSRGFGFVQYDNNSSVDRVMTEYASHKIEGKWVEVKRSVPRDQMPAPRDDDDRRGGSDRGSDRREDASRSSGAAYASYGVYGGAAGMPPAPCSAGCYPGYPGYPGYPAYGAYPGYPGYPAGYPAYPGYPPGYPAGYGGAYTMPPPGTPGMDPYAAAYGGCYGAPPSSAPPKTSGGSRSEPY